MSSSGRLTDAEYRATALEQVRTRDLLEIIPASGALALDVGARDGHFSMLLAERFDRVVALDLTMPKFSHPKVTCVKGNAAALEFEDASFDFILCAEVLEHVPPDILARVCSEMQRVCRGQLLIGVPYKQDLRIARTTCRSCGKSNPPWGHVNSFDQARLRGLFAGCTVKATRFVGQTNLQSNDVAAALMDWAGNPYGTYVQDEPCVYCDGPIGEPRNRTLAQKVLTKLAVWAQAATQARASPRGQWIHVLFEPRPHA